MTFQKIHDQVSALKTSDLGWRRLAASKRIDPCRELRKRERLDEIIVGARLEAGHSILDPSERGEHQYRDVDTGNPGAAKDRDPVEPRQHAIEDREIQFFGAEHPDRLEAVVRNDDRMPEIPQSPADEIARVGVVLCDKNAHFD